MNYTNKMNYHPLVVDLVEAKPYDSGESDTSVTRLLGAPYRVMLEVQHRDDIVEDIHDRIPALIGSMIHDGCEQRVSHTAHTAENRVFADIDGWKISGQFDVFTDNQILIDYKSMSVYQCMRVMREPKTEWSDQLNLLKALMNLSGAYKQVKAMAIVIINRDWRKAEAMRDIHYPRPIEVVEIEAMSDADAMQLLMTRLKLHQDAQIRGIYEYCTDDERWYTGDKWSVTKKGRKRALRLLDSEQDAIEWCKAAGYINGTDGIEIAFRKGRYNRCEAYCNVSEFCAVYQGDGNG